MHNYVDHRVWDECAANLHILFWRSRKQWLLFFIFPRIPIIIYELPYTLYCYHKYVPDLLLLFSNHSNMICTLTLSRLFQVSSQQLTLPPPSTYLVSAQYSHFRLNSPPFFHLPSVMCWFHSPCLLFSILSLLG